MATHVHIDRIGEHVGETVTLKGWLHNRRSSGKIHFLVVRDGTGFVQVVMGKNDVGEETFAAADHLGQESAVIITGTVRADAAGQGRLRDDRHRHGGRRPRRTTSRSRPKEHGVDFLMDRRHLWIRTERQTAILRVRHEVINAVRDFFNGEGFILADTPIFTPAACEGTTTLFPVQYFDDTTAYLTQSGQLYNEANAMALGKVYCFGPTFRAEKSKTRRHLTEFWMVEPEMAYADLDDVIGAGRAAGGLGRRRACSIDAQQELKLLERDTSKLEAVKAPFPRLHLRRGREDPRSTRACRSRSAPTSAAPTRPCCRSSSTARCASPTTRRRSRRST